MQRIVLGTDGSPPAQHAVRAALRLAHATGAELAALHAVERPTLYASAPVHDPRLAEDRERLAGDLLAEVRQRGEALGVPVATEVTEGDPGEALIEAVDERGADLVALGTHGHGQIARAVLGSVADRLVRHSPVPVLTAREETDRSPGEALERILIASDGSRPALAAASWGLGLAEATGAEADLVHVIAPEFEAGTSLDRPPREVAEAHEQMADQALDPIEEEARERDVEVQRFAPHGPVHGAIADHAVDRDADLIVVAAKGRGRLEAALVGSVADKLLRQAPAPLVTVPSGRRSR